jgi:hypothetical protein
MGDNDNIKTREELVQEFQKAFASTIQAIDFEDSKQRQALALTFLKYVQLNVERDNILPLIADVETVPVGATPQWIVRKGVKAYVHEPGTYAPRSMVTQITNTIQSEMISVHPEMEISQLQAGRYGSIADITSMCKEELLGRKYAAAWTTLINSITTTTEGSNYGTYNTTSSVTAKKNIIVSGLKWVEDVGKGARAIVGRFTLVADITEFDGYSEVTKSEIDRAGWLGRYRGVPIVSLKQYTDGYGVRLINADNIMIVSNETTKLAITEPLQVREAIDIDTLMWHMHMWEKYGFGVFLPEFNFKIACDTSET